MTDKTKKILKLIIALTSILILVFVLFALVMKMYIQNFMEYGFGEPGELVWYDSKLGNLSILYPKNWAILDTPRGNHGDNDVIVDISDPRYFTHITISYRKYDNENTEDLLNWEKMRLSSIEGISGIKNYEYQAKGTQGIIYEYAQPGQNYLEATTLQCKDWIFLKRNTGYIVHSCTHLDKWDDRKELISRMVDSITIK